MNERWRRIRPFVFLILFAVAWFGNLNYRSLFQTDEGRYAEIPREMVVTGHWLTPRLDGLRYFEKPPLQYWATAVSFTLFGFHNWSARLWSALCGFACILLVFVTGRRLWGERVGWLSALATASSLYVVFMGHFNTLDMSLTFFFGAQSVCVLDCPDARGENPGASLLDVRSLGSLGLRSHDERAHRDCFPRGDPLFVYVDDLGLVLAQTAALVGRDGRVLSHRGALVCLDFHS
jgi:4-amino-4-deoxy-L-arabinose transferase-like glycosyltransferase